MPLLAVGSGMDQWRNRIVTGDAFDVLPTLPENSVHAVVTDPPYGLAFMGRDWDDFEPTEYQAWCEEWASEVKRVLKPGGHLLAFSGNRTHHRLFTGVEDAGFEIRDTITWHYGSGFPKASDISKTIDKRADAEREVVGMKRGYSEGRDFTNRNEGYTRPWNEEDDAAEKPYQKTEPATDAAEKWDGFKTGLKPATEYVVVARKPFDGATVDCVLEHGTGALNIDGCRVEGGEGDGYWPGGDDEIPDDELYGDSRTGGERNTDGRYPSNVVFDATEAERLDRAVGELAAGAHTPAGHERNIYSNGDSPNAPEDRQELDSGGPSRYFYTSKASKAERTEGGSIDNDHPTVKPLDLAEWLVRLVTAEGQVVLDPFAGSGTIPKAAKQIGRQFVGIERQAKYADVARARIGLSPADPAHVRAHDAQQGFEAFTDGGRD